jgi:hypothetical protein
MRAWDIVVRDTLFPLLIQVCVRRCALSHQLCAHDRHRCRSSRARRWWPPSRDRCLRAATRPPPTSCLCTTRATLSVRAGSNFASVMQSIAKQWDESLVLAMDGVVDALRRFLHLVWCVCVVRVDVV